MIDLIKRQDALDAFGLSDKTQKYGGDHSGYDNRMLYEIQDILESLPSVDTERKKGRWLWDEEDRCYCSECGNEDDLSIDGVYMMHDFCPNCGANMGASDE